MIHDAYLGAALYLVCKLCGGTRIGDEWVDAGCPGDATQKFDLYCQACNSRHLTTMFLRADGTEVPKAYFDPPIASD